MSFNYTIFIQWSRNHPQTHLFSRVVVRVMWAGNLTLCRLYFMFASTFFTVMPILMQNKSMKIISNMNVLFVKIAGVIIQLLSWAVCRMPFTVIPVQQQHFTIRCKIKKLFGEWYLFYVVILLSSQIGFFSNKVLN